MKIAITGHRPNKLNNDYDLVSPMILKIKQYIVDYIKGGIIHNELHGIALDLKLITGMALGIDTLFAKIAIEMNIPFIAAIPFKGQEGMWPPKSQAIYYNILAHATSIRICDISVDISPNQITSYSNTPFTSDKMQIRNEWMVDNCDLLIAVWDKSSGGTANCVKYAQSVKREIIFINPNDYR